MKRTPPQKQEPIAPWVLRIFVCYARADDIKLIRKSLKALKNFKNVEVFIDEKVDAGEEWQQRIDEEMKKAHIALLLVSTEFLASEAISQHEWPTLLERYYNKQLVLLPLLLSNCHYEIVPELAALQFVYDVKKPFSDQRRNLKNDIMVTLSKKILGLYKEQAMPIAEYVAQGKSGPHWNRLAEKVLAMPDNLLPGHFGEDPDDDDPTPRPPAGRARLQPTRTLRLIGELQEKGNETDPVKDFIGFVLNGIKHGSRIDTLHLATFAVTPWLDVANPKPESLSVIILEGLSKDSLAVCMILTTKPETNLHKGVFEMRSYELENYQMRLLQHEWRLRTIPRPMAGYFGSLPTPSITTSGRWLPTTTNTSPTRRAAIETDPNFQLLEQMFVAIPDDPYNPLATACDHLEHLEHLIMESLIIIKTLEENERQLVDGGPDWDLITPNHLTPLPLPVQTMGAPRGATRNGSGVGQQPETAVDVWNSHVTDAWMDRHEDSAGGSIGYKEDGPVSEQLNCLTGPADAWHPSDRGGYQNIFS